MTDFDVARCTIRAREAQEPGQDELSSKYYLCMKTSQKMNALPKKTLIPGVPGRLFEVPGAEKSNLI